LVSFKAGTGQREHAPVHNHSNPNDVRETRSLHTTSRCRHYRDRVFYRSKSVTDSKPVEQDNSKPPRIRNRNSCCVFDQRF